MRQILTALLATICGAATLAATSQQTTAARPAGLAVDAPLPLALGAPPVDLDGAMAALAAHPLAATDPDGATYEPRQNGVGNVFHDTCDDTGPADIKKAVLADDQSANVLFSWGSCMGKPLAYDDAVAYEIYDGSYSSAPTYVILALVGDEIYGVYDTNGSNDFAHWDLVDVGDAPLSYVAADNRNFSGFVIDAAGIGFPYAYMLVVRTFDANGDPADTLPNRAMPPIAFPFSCDWYPFHAATIETVAGAATKVATALGAAGFETGAVSPAGTSLLAWPTPGTTLDVLVDAAEKIPTVTAVRRAVPYLTNTIDDPEPTQWALDQTATETGWNVRSSNPVEVAVLDTGLDGGRHDMVGRGVDGYDAFGGTSLRGDRDESFGPHGTMVAGVIAANRNNGAEVAGINPGATVAGVRIFDHASCATDASLAAGLDWASARSSTRIVNMSVGGPQDSSTLRSAIERATDAGKILVAATGNDGQLATRANYPASNPAVIGVGASGPGPRVPEYSQATGTDLVAPGGSGETRTDGYAVLDEWDDVSYVTGTSFAAPFVAGSLSLWLADHPTATTSQARAALQSASIDIPGTSRDGAGLLQLDRLLDGSSAEAQPQPDPNPEPEPHPTTGPTSQPPSYTGFDGDPSTDERVATDDPFRAAIAISKQRFEDGTAELAVLARHDVFADALAGSALTARGPMLFTFADRLPEIVLDEIARSLAPGGTVYLLGGRVAVSNSVAAQIEDRGFSAARLGGQDRFETAASIADEVLRRGGSQTEALVARAYGPAWDPNGPAAWVDAIAGGGYAASRGTPLLLVGTNSYPDKTRAWLVRHKSEVTVLGGAAAVSAEVERKIAGDGLKVSRVAGSDRAETAKAVGAHLWGDNPKVDRRNVILLNLWDDRSWAFGLAAAGIAADNSAPIYGTNTGDVPATTLNWLTSCGTAPSVDVYAAGAGTIIPQARIDQLSAVDPTTC